jgi:hypothetical protein
MSFQLGESLQAMTLRGCGRRPYRYTVALRGRTNFPAMLTSPESTASVSKPGIKVRIRKLRSVDFSFVHFDNRASLRNRRRSHLIKRLLPASLAG